MTKFQTLTNCCKNYNATVEKCTKRGYYLLVMQTRPDYTVFSQFMNDLKHIGYEYIQDGCSNTEYYFTIKSIKK